MQNSRLDALSLVIPTLNASATLPATLSAVGGLVRETIMVDGGSRDETVSIARSAGAHVVTANRGRGIQLAAGARAANGDWLMFLHADSVPGPGWVERLGEFIADPVNRERAAVFRFAIQKRSLRFRIGSGMFFSRIFHLKASNPNFLIAS